MECLRNRFLVWICCLPLTLCAVAQVDLNQVVTAHFQQLTNLDQHHPPLLILFSGPPGSGKTTLAKALESELGAVRISTDEARKLLLEAGYDPFDAKLVRHHLEQLVMLTSTLSDNRRVIFDCSIDRVYHCIKERADALHFPTVLIRLQVTRELLEHRLREREQGASLERFVCHLDHWFAEYNALEIGTDEWIEIDATLPTEQAMDQVCNHLHSHQLLKGRPASAVLEWVQFADAA